jgi:argininosuccinate synthase
MNQNIVVLAYSGGLDTSYCVKYLTHELGLDVHAIHVNTGGFSKAEVSNLEKKAFKLGAVTFKSIDVSLGYYQDCIRYLLYGNVMRNQTYPLSVSSERLFQALAIVDYANKIGAKKVAHGSTGAGNDQVRFDLVFHVKGNNLEIITPIRDMQLSRETEIEYLSNHGFEWNQKKGQYSINEGIWGTSIGGKETLTSNESIPESVWPSQLMNTDSEVLDLHFTQGEITGINRKEYDHPLEAISDLNGKGAGFVIGRDTHVGDTIIGLKGRVSFEAPAALILIKAHQLLEKHILSKWQTHWKNQLAEWYGMLLHEGQFLDPVMRNIETFLESTQQNVTGKVKVKLLPYRFELIGIESEYDLMQADFGTYGETQKGWSGQDAKGFIKMLSIGSKIHHQVNKNQDLK